MSIVTSSRSLLSELTERGDPASPFYNAFPVVRVVPFSKEDAEDFVNLRRRGAPGFTPEERDAILDFAKGHPLSLQVACFHVVDAREDRGALSTAIERARDDMKGHLPEA